MKTDRVRGHLDLLLLGALAAGPAHGYVVIGRLRDRTEGLFDLPEGSVYPALHRLEDAGLLASDWAEAGGRRRRIYRLTASGTAALSRERNDWRAFVTAVEAALGPASAVGPDNVAEAWA